jgi:hypothetical protein
MSTHPSHQFPALAATGPKDAFFLGGLLHDVLRSARHTRSTRIDVHEYAVEAHCSSLGAALVAERRAHRKRYGDTGPFELRLWTTAGLHERPDLVRPGRRTRGSFFDEFNFQ